MAGAAPYTVPLLAVLALAGTGCRVREQAEGPYAFTAAEVEKDDCLLVPATGELFDGDFFSTGNDVVIQYAWYGMRLAGAYRGSALFDQSPESFYADGSAQNVPADVGALHCELDQATVHLDGVTDTSTTLHGSLRFRYEARAPDGCWCETWVSFVAAHR